MKSDRNIYEIMDEPLLFRCISNGDREAFAFVYDKYAPILYLFCLRYLKNQEDAEDSLQHIFLKLWEKRNDLSINQSIKDYLYSAAKHHVLNLIRNKMTAQTKHQDIAGRIDQSVHSVEDDYLKGEAEGHLDIATKALSPIKQRIVAMRRDGFSNKEISQQLHIPENTVKTYYAQSLKFFREYFRKIAFAVISFLLNCVS